MSEKIDWLINIFEAGIKNYMSTVYGSDDGVAAYDKVHIARTALRAEIDAKLEKVACLTAEVEKLKKLLHEIYDNCEQCRDFEIVGFRCARCQTIERTLRGEK